LLTPKLNLARKFTVKFHNEEGLGMRQHAIRLSAIVFSGAIALGLGSCGLFGGGGDVDTQAPADGADAGQPTEVPVPAPNDTAAAPTETQPLTTEGEAADGTVPMPEELPPVGMLPPDLIRSTDPAQRRQEIEQNRTDPFSIIAPAPIVEIPEDAEDGGTTRRPAAPGGLAPIPDLVPTTGPTTIGPTTPVTPPPPQPDIARAVEVTGVVQVGNVPYAIVNAPNEPTSRYVRAGQMLSNGTVLVKRIDVFRGVEPVVVLEQYGIEVVRTVGGGGSPAADPAAVMITGMAPQ
jgi:hypothetical protein